MRALTWHGKHDVRVDTVPDPEIVNPRDAIIKITATVIKATPASIWLPMPNKGHNELMPPNGSVTPTYRK